MVIGVFAWCWALSGNHSELKEGDIVFRFGNGAWYCSELVYDIYKIQLGVELCRPHPVSDCHLTDKIRAEMRRRGISESQLLVSPVDIFNSDKLH